MPTPQASRKRVPLSSPGHPATKNAFRYKKPGFLPRTPLPPNEPYNFLREMAPYIEICYAYLGPAQKFGLFVAAGGQTCGKVCQSIACPYSANHTHTRPILPKNKRTTIRSIFRFRLQPIPCTIVIFALKASLRISLSNGLESFGIHLQCERFESAKAVSASNPQRLEQGARLGQLYRYKRERTKTTRSSHWTLCRKVCT